MASYQSDYDKYRDEYLNVHLINIKHHDKAKVNRNIWCCRFCGQIKSWKLFKESLNQTCIKCHDNQMWLRRRANRYAQEKIEKDEWNRKLKIEAKDRYIIGLGYSAETLLKELKMRRDGQYPLHDIELLMRVPGDGNTWDNIRRYGMTFSIQLTQICHNMIYHKDIFENVDWDSIILP